MYTWSRYDGYEVSSKGDSRFSAFYAKLRDGRTIEEAYQLDVKGYRREGNNPRVGKGKPPINGKSQEQLWKEYLNLWITWAEENVNLILELKEIVKSYGNELSDLFATTEINQAHALAEILNIIEK